jgi:hypothetical protein
MRDEYAADIGDFGKLALLRHIGINHRLGICWYKTTDPRKNKNDGRHIKYLSNETDYRSLDPTVFDALKAIIHTQRRSIAALEESSLLPEAIFYDSAVPMDTSVRRQWAEGMTHKVSDCDFVFVDPDNGIEGQRLTNKHVAVSELAALKAKRRILVLYHHQRRHPAEQEADYLRKTLTEAGWSPVELVRFRPWSSRFYAIAGHDARVSKKLEAFVSKWGDKIVYFPTTMAS